MAKKRYKTIVTLPKGFLCLAMQYCWEEEHTCSPPFSIFYCHIETSPVPIIKGPVMMMFKEKTALCSPDPHILTGEANLFGLRL
jgi:hypothetical protein